MRNRMRAVAVVSLSLFAAHAGAQVTSPKLILQGTNSVEVPLEATSSVTVNANGDLQAQCRGGQCPTGTGGGNVSATLTPSATEVTTAIQFSLSWTSTGAEVCRGVAPTNVSGWADQLLGTSGSRNLSLPTGEYVFTIRCYGQGASADHSTAQVNVIQGGGQTGDNYCSEYYNNSTPARILPTHASFSAYGLQKVETAYQTIFEVLPGATQSAKRVLPGNWLRPAAGRYLAIPFVMTATEGNLANLDLSWIEGGALGTALIPPVPSGSIAFTVSPCAGDLRRMSTSAADPFERGQCRRTTPSSNGMLKVTSDPNQVGSCYVPTGKIVYLNIAAYNLDVTSLPATSRCGSNETCGVSVQVD